MAKGPTPLLDALVDRVNAYCEDKHGSKVALAAHLGIDKQAMNKILTRANEPGGEKVLAMLVWLEERTASKAV